MLKIISAPNDVLSQKAKPVPLRPAEPGFERQVAKIDKDILHLIEGMKKTLLATHDPEGVGLAAPQVSRSLQLFIIKPTKKSKIQVFVNPQIYTSLQARGANEIFAGTTRDEELMEKKSNIPFDSQKNFISDLSALQKKRDKKGIKLEGCLSLPNIWGEVERANEVEISYIDEKGKSHTKLFKGFTATIIQHEYDHLLGNLFPKRVLEQKGKLYKSKKNKKGEDEFEEIEL